MDHTGTSQWRVSGMQPGECFISLIGGASIFQGESRHMCVSFCEQNKAFVVEALPASLAEIGAIGGFELIIDLVNSYGGKRLYLPTRAARFFDMTGLDVPSVVYQHWRDIADVNGQLDIPSSWGLFLSLRRAAIRVAVARKWPPEMLHATFGVSRRQLKAYRN
ncbi:hypothetical protein PQS31_09805 [Luteimonas sp BLCC-B24]|uniref:hypothetical protein n=1 Tax=Luteimonas sp. BLCC-B24 TaxID=3025317 RepID=UPI00234D2EFA|nr:hypothetical protein [Luteimonas sp. BLCC-B24]MDC7807114.1 hypothetical protein [Luteimonas sp. BLCC-B24]